VDLCKKKEHSGAAQDLEERYGRTWIWTAIDVPTRLLITFWIGGRELDDARRMLQDLIARGRGKPLFVSDELPHYATVLEELFHRLVPPARTGKPGRPKNPERVIPVGRGLRYAACFSATSFRSCSLTRLPDGTLSEK